MTIRPSNRVVVATGGSAGSHAAIAYAAGAAAALGVPLELVHVVTPTVPVAPAMGSPDIALRRAGHQILDEGARLAHELQPHVEVTTTLLTGARADAVVHHMTDAALVVVGAPPLQAFERIWGSSTVMGIAARAACPVAVIPADAQASTTHRVVVGVKELGSAERLLATAFAVADRTGSELRVVHAWHMGSPYDEAIAERVPSPASERKEAASIEAALIDLRLAHPSVVVQVAVVHGSSPRIMLAEAKGADLVVISRPAHGGLVHHLGSTARSLLRQSSCPVLVVPPRTSALTSTDDAAAGLGVVSAS